MLTDIPRPRTAATKFALRAVVGSVGLFGLLRLTWTETHLVLPITRLQGALAEGLFGTPALPVEITLACSGADALALCLGAVLAYPVRWRVRLAGAVGGTALILGLNTLRIGTLGRVSASPEWFNALHLYVWPAILTLAIAGYVFTWMQLADRMARARLPVEYPPRSRRFVALTAALLIMFAAASPFYLESPQVLALGGVIAHAAALILGAAGVSTHAAANVLWTPRGGFIVTQECISTPLIPIYLAAIGAYATTWRWMVLGVVATVPLFTALGIARLLVVVLPEAVIASPIFVMHAFYQLLLGVVVVLLAALWRHGRKSGLARAAAGVLAGALFVSVLGPLYSRVVSYPTGALLADPQGAIAFLPAFQTGLFLALWVAAVDSGGWRRFLGGLTVLGLTQTAGLLALHALSASTGLTAHVRDIRGWAVAGPVLMFAAIVSRDRTSR